MAGSSTRDWDATTYQRVALPHEEWARAVLDRLGLEGGETVLDAGCGSGRTTAIVIERLPDGRVIAVDGSPSMVEKVREVLRPERQGDRQRPDRAGAGRAGRRGLLDRRLPLDPRPRRALRPHAGGAPRRRPLRRPVRGRGQHRRLPPRRRGGRRARALRRAPRGGFEELGTTPAPEVTEERLRERRLRPRSDAGSSPGRSTRPSPPSSRRTSDLGPYVERAAGGAPRPVRRRRAGDPASRCGSSTCA